MAAPAPVYPLNSYPMRKRKWLPLAAIFILLGALSVWYLLSNAADPYASLKEERRFAVADTSRIGKIFLAHRDNETVSLERKGTHWIYNGKWIVRPGAMENLLDAVRRIEIKYQPAQAAVPNMVRNLGSEGIKVEIYDKRNRLLTVYYVGGSTPDERGTFVIREGYNQPYVAHLPGWEGNLRFRYSLKGEDWRDRSVFAEDPDRILSVSVEYPKQRSQSFRLEKKESGYRVTPFYPGTPEIRASFRPGAAEAYLVGFENLVAEAFENAYTGRDSVEQMIPFAVVTLKDRDNQVKTVKFYPILPASPATDPKSGMLSGSAAVERYFASVSTGDFMLVQNRVFKKIFWAYPFFFETGNQ